MEEDTKVDREKKMVCVERVRKVRIQREPVARKI
jgi:hypothetical protein